MSSVRVVTPPEYEPVTLAEAKVWCRIEDDDTEQDAIVLMLIIAMREMAEDLTGRSYVPRTLELSLGAFPSGGVIELPFPPVQSVTSVTYIDGNGTAQVLSGSPTAWQEDLSADPAVICPLYATNWPTTRAVLGAVKVRYVAGYSTLPRNLRLWMQTRISTLFDNRNQFMVGGQIMQRLPRDFTDGLLDGLLAKRMFA